MIRIPQVRVVDEEGAQLGVMPTPQALEMAQERGLDLVEVAPMAAPPVVKFLDFGQYKYELTKREKEAKRKQRSVTFKEVRLSPKIGVGDFDTKVHRAIEFLEDGDRIKVTVRFRGRELTHPELGRNLLARFVDGSRNTGSRSGRRCSKASRCTSRWHRSTSRRCTKHRTGTRRRGAATPADRRARRRHRRRGGNGRGRRPQPQHRPSGSGRDRNGGTGRRPTAATAPAEADDRATGAATAAAPKTTPRPAGRRGHAAADTGPNQKQSTPAPEPVTSGE